MRILVGLGNPGAQYLFTRHNVGYMCVDYIQEKRGCSRWKREHLSLYSTCGNSILVKPTTYMNLSGEALPKIFEKFKCSAEDLIVIYDDVALPLGKIRIRKKGSDGGHNGIKSIINVLGTEYFIRIRVGIGPKPDGIDLASYVLSEFTQEELEKLYKVLHIVYEAAGCIIEEGVDKAMSIYNAKEVE